MLDFSSHLRGREWPIRPVVVALAAALAGNCSGSASKPDAAPEPNVAPVNYRDSLTTTIRGMLEDPTGVRDAFITEPALRPSGTETRYIVCLRYNAKNRDGTYSGSKDRAAIFYGGSLTTITDATREQCGNAPWQPYPEIEKFCREVVCPIRR